MKTANTFVNVFRARTEGRRRTFTVVNLTLDAVKTVLKGEMLRPDTSNTAIAEDVEDGYIRRNNRSGFYGGADGYIPTAKGYRAILKQLEAGA